MQSCLTLREFFNQVYRPLKLRGKSANTSRLYEATFASMQRLLGREPTLDDVTSDLAVSAYLEKLASTRSARTGRMLSAYTVEKQRTQICAIARLAFDRGLVQVGTPRLSIGPETLPERTPEAWTTEEMARIYDAATRHPGRFGKILVRSVMPALISLIYDTGERITACLETMRDDYHRPHVLVRAEARKGRRKDKLFQLSPETCEMLEALCVPSLPYLIPIPRTSRSRVWPILGEIIEAAGLPGGRGSKFHKIRRTVASFYVAAGHDATALLGHSSKRITDRWYADPRITGGPTAPCSVIPRLVPPAAPSAAG